MFSFRNDIQHLADAVLHLETKIKQNQTKCDDEQRRIDDAMQKLQEKQKNLQRLNNEIHLQRQLNSQLNQRIVADEDAIANAREAEQVAIKELRHLDAEIERNNKRLLDEEAVNKRTLSEYEATIDQYSAFYEQNPRRMAVEQRRAEVVDAELRLKALLVEETELTDAWQIMTKPADVGDEFYPDLKSFVLRIASLKLQELNFVRRLAAEGVRIGDTLPTQSDSAQRCSSQWTGAINRPEMAPGRLCEDFSGQSASRPSVADAAAHSAASEASPPPPAALHNPSIDDSLQSPTTDAVQVSPEPTLRHNDNSSFGEKDTPERASSKSTSAEWLVGSDGAAANSNRMDVDTTPLPLATAAATPPAAADWLALMTSLDNDSPVFAVPRRPMFAVAPSTDVPQAGRLATASAPPLPQPPMSILSTTKQADSGDKKPAKHVHFKDPNVCLPPIKAGAGAKRSIASKSIGTVERDRPASPRRADAASSPDRQASPAVASAAPLQSPTRLVPFSNTPPPPTPTLPLIQHDLSADSDMTPSSQSPTAGESFLFKPSFLSSDSFSWDFAAAASAETSADNAALPNFDLSQFGSVEPSSASPAASSGNAGGVGGSEFSFSFLSSLDSGEAGFLSKLGDASTSSGFTFSLGDSQSDAAGLLTAPTASTSFADDFLTRFQPATAATAADSFLFAFDSTADARKT